jgi:hypothetical protein
VVVVEEKKKIRDEEEGKAADAVWFRPSWIFLDIKHQTSNYQVMRQ